MSDVKGIGTIRSVRIVAGGKKVAIVRNEADLKPYVSSPKAEVIRAYSGRIVAVLFQSSDDLPPVVFGDYATVDKDDFGRKVVPGSNPLQGGLVGQS